MSARRPGQPRSSTGSTWLRAKDPGLVATRRAARTALVMPALFAFANEVLHSPTIASFAAFGSFSMLLLVDFSGPMVERLRAQAGLAVSWGVLICLGTVVAHLTWLAVVTTVVIAFLVLFSGVVSSVLAGSATALLLAFVLPVSAPVPLSQLPERLAGAGLAAAVALPAIALLWPRPTADPLSTPAALVCRTAAEQLRAEAARLDPAQGPATATYCRAAAERTADASGRLRRAFDATPYRPTGLSTTSRALVRLVDELTWLSAILADHPAYTDMPPTCDPAARAARRAAAAVLEQAADLLADLRRDVGPLRAAVQELRTVVTRLENSSTARLPVEGPVGDSPAEVYGFIATLDPSFRAQELGFAVLQIAANVGRAAAAEQRSWPDRLLGREPASQTHLLTSARERAAAHLEPHSVWLHNSLRGAVGLGIAVLLANVTSVQHSFWVLLGTLSVLRSNALSTGQNAARAILGTVVGSILGAGLLQLVGHHSTVLWFLLPVAVLIAGVAPAVISFTAGQAAFTVTLVVLFNIGQNPDWHIVLLRLQDIALGCGVSILVALFFWPRGAAAAVDKALAEAYTSSSRYLAGAVDYALGHCATPRAGARAGKPTAEAREAAASARRLDDAFRTYLAERGAKPVSLADMTTLVTGVVGLRLASDAVVSLWHRSGPDCGDADKTDAQRAILGAAARVTDWYRGLAASIEDHTTAPEPVPPYPESAARLVESVRTDLIDGHGQATALAVRVIWTGDHIEVARRLQPLVAGAANTGAVPAN